MSTIKLREVVKHCGDLRSPAVRLDDNKSGLRAANDRPDGVNGAGPQPSSHP